MENYFQEQELKDWELLKAFNEKTGIFTEIQPTKEKHHSDASGYTITKMGDTIKWNIELKHRNLNLLEDGRISGATDKGSYYDDTIFIESHKVADMLLDCIDGTTPLYINFLTDGHIIIFNLNNLKKRPRKSKMMNIRSKGYGKFEMAKREGLYITDAAIYNKEYKLVKKAGDEFGEG